MFEGLPKRIEPYVHMKALNEPIDLASGSFRLALPGTGEGKIDGHLRFKWLPSTAIEFEGDYSGPSIDLLNTKDVRLKIDENGLDAPAFVTRAAGWGTPTSIRGVLCGAASVGHGPIDRLRFCLANFPHYIGNPVSYEVEEHRGSFLGRMEFSSDELFCRVDEIQENRELVEPRSRETGYIITHVGEVLPANGTFDIHRVNDLLTILHRFFGFVRGAWAGPTFVQGFLEGQKTCELIAAPDLRETREVSTWLPQESRNPSDLFTGFNAKWSDPAWQQALLTSVSWYVEANASRAYPESRIVLGQVVLELLAWVEIVESRRLHSFKDFDRLTAAGRIRSLLHHLSIPAGLPEQFQELANLCDSEAFDGPGIVVLLRNALVHANKKKRLRLELLSNVQKWLAGQLALQYVELAFLALFGYRGKYARRAWRRGSKGEDEVLVPWAPTT